MHTQAPPNKSPRSKDENLSGSHLSSVQGPLVGCLIYRRYRGWNPTLSYKDYYIKSQYKDADLNQSGFNGTSSKGFVACCSLVNLKIANATMGILEGSETSRGRRISKSSKDSPEGQGFRFSAVVEGLEEIFSGSILVKVLFPWFIDGQVFFLQGLIDSDFRCKGSCEWEGFGACRCELEDLQEDVLCFSGWPRHYKRPPSRTQDRIFWTSWVDAGRPKTWEISVGA